MNTVMQRLTEIRSFIKRSIRLTTDKVQHRMLPIDSSVVEHKLFLRSLVHEISEHNGS